MICQLRHSAFETNQIQGTLQLGSSFLSLHVHLFGLSSSLKPMVKWTADDFGQLQIVGHCRYDEVSCV